MAKPANLTRGSHNNSVHSLSSFCTVNELEKSMSYVEKTAKKLLPILTEVKKRMIPDKKRVKQPSHDKNGKNGIRRVNKFDAENSQDSEDDEELIVDLNKLRGNK